MLCTLEYNAAPRPKYRKFSTLSRGAPTEVRYAATGPGGASTVPLRAQGQLRYQPTRLLRNVRYLHSVGSDMLLRVSQVG
eukprot:2663315-Rhodomonas_salina.1